MKMKMKDKGMKAWMKDREKDVHSKKMERMESKKMETKEKKPLK